MAASDKAYVDILLGGIRSIKNFKPMFGKGSGVGQDEFQKIYAADPLYHWVGFDSPLMYAAHRAGGAMTSLYRNLGTGCEHLFREILRNTLNLTAKQLRWEYAVGAEDIDAFAGASEPAVHPENISEIAGASEDVAEAAQQSGHKGKRNSLDGRIDLADVKDLRARKRIAGWLERLRAKQSITWEPLGAVFEVRQGYKSMDAKRQAADIANAAQALGRQRLPVLVIFSNQIDDNLIKRYSASGWSILRGVINGPTANDPLVSTYAFMKQVIGYDLAEFFGRNVKEIRHETAAILETLLTTE